jgi:hypothetical protein
MATSSYPEHPHRTKTLGLVGQRDASTLVSVCSSEMAGQVDAGANRFTSVGVKSVAFPCFANTSDQSLQKD